MTPSDRNSQWLSTNVSAFATFGSKDLRYNADTNGRKVFRIFFLLLRFTQVISLLCYSACDRFSYNFPLLNPSLAEHDMSCLSKQCRSVKKPTDLDLHCFLLNM